jgi:hypothetical protein
MVSFTSATTSDDPPKATVVLTNGSRDLYEGSQHLAFGEVRRVGSADWEGADGSGTRRSCVAGFRPLRASKLRSHSLIKCSQSGSTRSKFRSRIWR